MEEKKKILIIRFSSIGDIVLTTPVVRALFKQGNAEVHFLTKKSFLPIISANPYISKVHTIDSHVKEVITSLKNVGFDYIIDLHKNIRSFQVIKALKVSSKSFSKLNVEKWLKVHLKIDLLPDKHIVDRYLDAGAFLSLQKDNEGLDYFFANDAHPFSYYKNKYELPDTYLCIAIGAAHFTKRIPNELLVNIIKEVRQKVVLLGGPLESKDADWISREVEVINTVGKESIAGSARLIENAKVLVTPDTGMMHIGAALQVPIVSIWGNTIPGFGMYPYMNEDKYQIAEVEGLSCRPCSKIGHAQCPKGHFKCMKSQNLQAIVEQIQTFIEK